MLTREKKKHNETFNRVNLQVKQLRNELWKEWMNLRKKQKSPATTMQEKKRKNQSEKSEKKMIQNVYSRQKSEFFE